MRLKLAAALSSLLVFGLSPNAQSASLQVAPVVVEVTAPGAAATITLKNQATRTLNAQVRVFRWSQSGGEDRYEPTQDVVASPPSVGITPKADYSLRVVRVARTPVQGEETYRMLIDEIPDPARQRNGAISLVLRYSVPVFFSSPDASPAKLVWTVTRNAGGRLVVTAQNTGDRRLRIAALKLTDAKGTQVSFGGGLIGYALGRSTFRWTAPGRTSGFGPGAAAAVSAQTDSGPLNAQASVQ